MTNSSGARRAATLSPPTLIVAAAFALLLALAPAASAAPAQPLELSSLGRTAAPGVENQAEIAAFDPATKRVFTTNAADNALDVYDFADPSAPGGAVDSIDLSPFGGGPNSVAVSGDLVAVAVEGETAQQIGTVQFFDTAGKRLGGIRAGALPDMVTFARNGDYLLVANEGEPADDGSVDPEGSVTVVDMRGGLDDLIVRQVGLHGVPLRGPVRLFTPGSSAAQDLEPEYITAQGNRAFVSFQEANAIGVLDIAAGRFERIRSLGFKDHGAAGNGLDASDEDGGVNIQNWDNVFGMYQPDAIAAYTLPVKKRVRCKKGRKKGKRACKRKRAKTFVATANEGDTRDFDFFSEESRAKDLSLDPDSFAADAGEDENLGRLTVTTTLGDDDGDGDYERLFVPGARSLSIVGAGGKLAFDTGDELEQLAADLDPTSFNTNNAAGSDPDNRSDNKGPEPEALAVGKVGGRPYAFVGAERSGGIYAYDLRANKGKARFAGYVNTREDDLGPEGALFVPAGKSPTGRPLLLVTYEISSTVAAYEITVE